MSKYLGKRNHNLVSLHKKKSNYLFRYILIIFLVTFTLVSAIKQSNQFQYLELKAFDYLIRIHSQKPFEERILIIEFTENDLFKYGWPIPSRTLIQLVQKIQEHEPAVVGLNLNLNELRGSEREQLKSELEFHNLLVGVDSATVLTNGRSSTIQSLPYEKLGFNDLPLDPDGVVRRILLLVGNREKPYLSFALKIVMSYLPELVFDIDPQGRFLKLGDFSFPALNPSDGGYTTIDARGYQTLLRYRSLTSSFRTLSFSDIIEDNKNPDFISKKIVLIGSNATSLRDDFLTPLSRNSVSDMGLSGVEIHAHAISQLLDQLTERSSLYRFLPQWGELVWILVWIFIPAILIIYCSQPIVLVVVAGCTVPCIFGISNIAINYLYWLPTVEPIIGFLIAISLGIGQKAIYHHSYDSLTWLPSRDIFLVSLERELSISRGRSIALPLIVAFLDIDRFRIINQSFGHSAGDDVLRTIAQRLNDALPEAAYLSRMGGDEFAFWLRVPKCSMEELLLKHLQMELSKPIVVAQHRLSIKSSMGIVLVDSKQIPKPEDLLRDAHTAMYRAKALSKDHYEVFVPTMHEEAVYQLTLESKLLFAFDNREFLLYYQPIVCMETDKVIGLEALIRWYRQEEGLILPGKFIHLVEETGLIINLGQWVFREACCQLMVWQRELQRDDLKISINLSRRQFRQSDLVEQFTHTLDSLGLDGSCVQLEITESVIMGDVARAQTLMNQLKSLGFQLAIDDFGTGYSSLSYLNHFPADTLKIDKSFVMPMDTNPGKMKIVQAIISLGINLDMKLVAEGVENINQANLLKELGCQIGQGYLFSKPLPEGEATNLLAQEK